MLTQENTQDWVHPDARQFFQRFLEECARTNSMIHTLMSELWNYDHSQLFDSVDYFEIGESSILITKLDEWGFKVETREEHYVLYKHPSGHFPRIVLQVHSHPLAGGVALRLNSIAHFLMLRDLHKEIEGCPYSAFRRCKVCTENRVSLWLVERRGTAKIESQEASTKLLQVVHDGVERWQLRQRKFSCKKKGLLTCMHLLRSLVDKLGRDTTTWIVLENEIAHWKSNTPTGRARRNKEEELGLSWSGEHHYTFRSTRENFLYLYDIFDLLGFVNTGVEYHRAPSYGTYTLRQVNAAYTVCIEVDMSEDECNHQLPQSTLKAWKHPGEIDTWCKKHGESILEGTIYQSSQNDYYYAFAQYLRKADLTYNQIFCKSEALKETFKIGERLGTLHDETVIKKMEVHRYLYVAPESEQDILRRGVNPALRISRVPCGRQLRVSSC